MSKAFERPLFHGTIADIPQIDITKGRLKKDFGQGFYLALEKDQAIGMMQKKFREAVRRSRGMKESLFVRRLYRISLRASAESSLSVKLFAAADMEWLDFILANRQCSEGRCHSFDIVVGPTADDDTVVSLQNYWKGIYGPVGSRVAKQALLDALEVDNLGVQCCLCTQKAVDAAVATFEQVDWSAGT